MRPAIASRTFNFCSFAMEGSDQDLAQFAAAGERSAEVFQLLLGGCRVQMGGGSNGRKGVGVAEREDRH